MPFHEPPTLTQQLFDVGSRVSGESWAKQLSMLESNQQLPRPVPLFAELDGRGPPLALGPAALEDRERLEDMSMIAGVWRAVTG